MKRNEEGQICTIWLYNDGTNPINNPKNPAKAWDEYFSKLKKLAKLLEAEAP